MILISARDDGKFQEYIKKKTKLKNLNKINKNK